MKWAMGTLLCTWLAGWHHLSRSCQKSKCHICWWNCLSLFSKFYRVNTWVEIPSQCWGTFWGTWDHEEVRVTRVLSARRETLKDLEKLSFRGIVSKCGGCHTFLLLQTGWKHKHVRFLFQVELWMILSLISSASSGPETGRHRSREAKRRSRRERVREKAAANKGLRMLRTLLKTHLDSP